MPGWTSPPQVQTLTWNILRWNPLRILQKMRLNLNVCSRKVHSAVVEQKEFLLIMYDNMCCVPHDLSSQFLSSAVSKFKAFVQRKTNSAIFIWPMSIVCQQPTASETSEPTQTELGKTVTTSKKKNVKSLSMSSSLFQNCVFTSWTRCGIRLGLKQRQSWDVSVWRTSTPHQHRFNSLCYYNDGNKSDTDAGNVIWICLLIDKRCPETWT